MSYIRVKTLGMLWLVVAVVGFAVLPSMASATVPTEAAATIPTEEGSAGALLEVEPLLESCDSGHVCNWPGTYYSGERHETLCIGNSYNVGTSYSAKNRCANKAVQFGRHEGEVIHYTFCMNPGGNRPAPGWFNWFWVLGEGSRC